MPPESRPQSWTVKQDHAPFIPWFRTMERSQADPVRSAREISAYSVITADWFEPAKRNGRTIWRFNARSIKMSCRSSAQERNTRLFQAAQPAGQLRTESGRARWRGLWCRTDGSSCSHWKPSIDAGIRMAIRLSHIWNQGVPCSVSSQTAYSAWECDVWGVAMPENLIENDKVGVYRASSRHDCIGQSLFFILR